MAVALEQEERLGAAPGPKGVPPALLDRVSVGDARALSLALPDESVDLLFTDPVYDRLEDYVWLAAQAMRVLKPNSAALIFCATGLLPQTLNALALGGLTYQWFVPHLTVGSGNYGVPGPVRYMGMIYAAKGKHTPNPRIYDVCWTNGVQDWHIWRKNLREVGRWINSCSRTGEVVWDPFAGGGTMLAAAAALDRQYVGFEISPVTADLATERIAGLHPRLDLVSYDDQPDLQAEMTLDGLGQDPSGPPPKATAAPDAPPAVPPPLTITMDDGVNFYRRVYEPGESLSPPPPLPPPPLAWDVINATRWEATDADGSIWRVRRSTTAGRYYVTVDDLPVGDYPTRADAMAGAALQQVAMAEVAALQAKRGLNLPNPAPTG